MTVPPQIDPTVQSIFTADPVVRVAHRRWVPPFLTWSVIKVKRPNMSGTVSKNCVRLVG